MQGMICGTQALCLVEVDFAKSSTWFEVVDRRVYFPKRF
jgi:hypothetical protein